MPEVGKPKKNNGSKTKRKRKKKRQKMEKGNNEEKKGKVNNKRKDNTTGRVSAMGAICVTENEKKVSFVPAANRQSFKSSKGQGRGILRAAEMISSRRASSGMLAKDIPTILKPRVQSKSDVRD